MKARAKKGLFLAVTALMTLALLEGGIWVATALSPSLDAALDGRSAVPRNLKDDVFAIRGNPEFPEHDARGFRNETVPEQATYVALGDSQTYGSGVAREEAWPARLEAHSGHSTYNMAFGGFGPLHSLALFEDALALKPDAIVEAFYSGNDLYDCFAMVYERDQYPEWRSDQEGVLDSIEAAQSEELLSDRAKRFFRMGRKAAADSSSTPVWQASGLYRVARASKRALASAVEDWELIKRRYQKHSEYCQIVETTDFQTVMTSPYRLCALDEDDVRIREGRRLALRALSAMGGQAREAQVPFLIVLIPTKELTFATLVEKEGLDLGDAYRTLIATERRHWEDTRAFLEQEGLAYLDALDVLRASFQRGTSPYSITTDGHMNAVGQDALAQAIAERLDHDRGTEEESR